MTTPYRQPSTEAQFICIVCYERASAVAAVCPHCDAPMQPLSDPAVVGELRARAAKKKSALDGRRLRILAPASLLIVILLHGMLLWTHAYDVAVGHDVFQAGANFYLGFFVIPLIYWLIVYSLFEVAAKRLHLFETNATIDPQTAPVADLLGWLNIR